MLTYAQMSMVFAPVIRESKPRGILREYLQYMILKAIYTSPYASRLVFLGGTCLRIVYGSQRFSEDLDFDNRGLTEEEWEDLGNMIVRYLEAEGLSATNQVIYKGAFYCYIKIPHILEQYGFSPHEDEKILIQIDTVAQGFFYEPVVTDIDQFGISSRILSTPRDTLLSQKIRAAYERKRTKGRDFYDIRYLMSLGATPDYAYLGDKMGISDQKSLFTYMHEKNASIDFDALTRDLAPFLFRAEDLRLVREFPLMVDTELARMDHTN